jgi:hypothetical protein
LPPSARKMPAIRTEPRRLLPSASDTIASCGPEGAPIADYLLTAVDGTLSRTRHS